MGTRERPADRGTARGRRLLVELGREFAHARRRSGLSLRTVAEAAGVSVGVVWRFEGGRATDVGVVVIARLFAIVGLDLSARAYPGGPPVRDAGPIGLLAEFRGRCHPSLGWATEVPLPIARDQRAWDGMLTGPGWRYGCEAEMGPDDSQALQRRIELKIRDGHVSGAVLLLPETRRTRAFLAVARPALGSTFPVQARYALAAFADGRDPGGSSIIVLRARARPRVPPGGTTDG
jgi:transcriptional regulator with XRE-family HTH domain